MTGPRFYTKAYLEKQTASEPSQSCEKTQDIHQAIPDRKPRPNVAKRTPVQKPKPVAADLRAAEVEQLKLRFHDLTIDDEPDEHDYISVSFLLPITDPDFPYELEGVHLKVRLHKDYPRVVPRFCVTNTDIPVNILNRIESRLNTIVNTIKEGEMSVRPMLKYLENNLESIVTCTLSIKFINPADIKVTPPADAVKAATSRTTGLLKDDADKDVLVEQLADLRLRPGRFEEGTFIKLSDPKALGPGSYTMDCSLGENVNFQVSVCSLLSLTVLCSKCSQSNDLSDVRPESEKLANCVKCRRLISVSYHPEYIVEGKTRIGQCRLSHCHPLDLLPSQWQLECGNCLCSIRVNKVQFGERITYPCRNCGNVLQFQLEGCRWSEASIHSPASKGKKAAPERLFLTIGQPLPNHGTCQHYSKSFRWYRFPCCGRAFPCDLCHNAASPDHPMQWADRFLCGQCSREHSITAVNKRCVCGADPKTRTTAHWEGGKGLRDQSKMSRKDDRKYRGRSKQN